MSQSGGPKRTEAKEAKKETQLAFPTMAYIECKAFESLADNTYPDSMVWPLTKDLWAIRDDSDEDPDSSETKVTAFELKTGISRQRELVNNEYYFNLCHLYLKNNRYIHILNERCLFYTVEPLQDEQIPTTLIGECTLFKTKEEKDRFRHVLPRVQFFSGQRYIALDFTRREYNQQHSTIIYIVDTEKCTSFTISLSMHCCFTINKNNHLIVFPYPEKETVAAEPRQFYFDIEIDFQKQTTNSVARSCFLPYPIVEYAWCIAPDVFLVAASDANKLGEFNYLDVGDCTLLSCSISSDDPSLSIKSRKIFGAIALAQEPSLISLDDSADFLYLDSKAKEIRVCGVNGCVYSCPSYLGARTFDDCRFILLEESRIVAIIPRCQILENSCLQLCCIPRFSEAEEIMSTELELFLFKPLANTVKEYISSADDRPGIVNQSDEFALPLARFVTNVAVMKEHSILPLKDSTHWEKKIDDIHSLANLNQALSDLLELMGNHIRLVRDESLLKTQLQLRGNILKFINLIQQPYLQADSFLHLRNLAASLPDMEKKYFLSLLTNTEKLPEILAAIEKGKLKLQQNEIINVLKSAKPPTSIFISDLPSQKIPSEFMAKLDRVVTAIMEKELAPEVYRNDIPAILTDLAREKDCPVQVKQQLDKLVEKLQKQFSSGPERKY